MSFFSVILILIGFNHDLWAKPNATCVTALTFTPKPIESDEVDRVITFFNDVHTEYLRDYQKKGFSENYKHVHRMASIVESHASELWDLEINPVELIASIYVSDVAKEDYLLAKNQLLYTNPDGSYGNKFAAFLDHSYLGIQAANALRKKHGISRETWQRIVGGIIGHDGPSIDGTWWKKYYEAILGRQYPSLQSRQGVVHSYLDRMDQGGLYRMADGSLQGGVRKISYEIFKNPGPAQGKLAATIKYILENVHETTKPQLAHLEQVLIPKFFPQGDFPEFLRKQRTEFDKTPEFFKFINFFDNENIVMISNRNGTTITVSTLNDFWYHLSRLSK